MKMRITYILVFIIFTCFDSIIAQTYTGSSAGQFLKIGVGARAEAMGSAFAAVANDASAVYWNPAGSALLTNNSATFSHTYWLAETYHDYAAIVIKLPDGNSLALSYTSLSMDDMKVTNEYYQDGTGEYFSASDIAMGITYAFNLTSDFSMGFTAKYISQNIWHMNASAFALDVGLYYSSPVKGLKLGMSVTNVGSKMKYEGEDNFIYYSFDHNLEGNSDKIFSEIKMDSWDLPLTFRVGLAYELLNTEHNNILISCDAVHPNDYNEYVNVGFEYSFNKTFFLRAGYKSIFKIDSEEGLTAGVGLLYHITDFIPMNVDYSYSDFGRLTEIHRISLQIGF
jgi:opacity protein-like surface antigen